MQTINTTTAAVTVDQVVDDGGQMPPAVQLVFQTALIVPVPTPQGPQPLPIAFGSNSVELTKQQALDLADQVRATAEGLPDPKPHIDVANSLDGVEQVADFERQLRDGRSNAGVKPI